jgi:hypothetical protein
VCRDINNNFSFFFPLSHSLFFLYFLVRQSADVTVEREDREAERGKLGKSPYRPVDPIVYRRTERDISVRYKVVTLVSPTDIGSKPQR